MKVLTLHRPWAAFVASGDKPIENRTWAPPAALLGQRFAIHAGQGWDPRAVRWARETLGLEVDPAQHHEGILATVRLVGWCSADGTLFRWVGDAPAIDGPGVNPLDLIGPRERAALFGPFGWILREPRLLAPRVPCRGHQGLWNVPHNLLAQVAP